MIRPLRGAHARLTLLLWSLPVVAAVAMLRRYLP
jgi:hypothetical protein